MATAVSFVGEGNFDYLELFNEGETIGQVIMKLENKFGKAWPTLEVVRVKSTEINTHELRAAIGVSLSNSEQSENEGA